MVKYGQMRHPSTIAVWPLEYKFISVLLSQIIPQNFTKWLS